MNILTVTKKQDQKTFEDLQFVARAVGKDKDRPHLNVLVSTGKRLLATDGKRMHTAKNRTIHEGFYLIVKNNSKEIMLVEQEKCYYEKYPNIRDIYIKGLKKVLEHDMDIYRDQEENMYIAYSKILRSIPDNQSLNFFYIRDIIDYMEYFMVYRRPNANTTYDPIYFKDHTRSAVLMPIFDK